MTLEQHTVFDAFYMGLKRNGWSKEAAAKAAHQHLKALTPKTFKKELADIVATLPPNPTR